jgi:protein-histidine pros-kinase
MKTMACQDAQAHLLDYAEGELDDALRAALREHVTGCPDCRRELQEIESLRSSLGRERVPDPGLAFWEKFPDRVLQAYRAELSAAGRTRPGLRAGLDQVAQWWATMGLRLRFNLALLAVFALGLGASGYVSYEVLHTNAREEVVRNAGLILEAALSMRGYTVGQIRPLLERDSEKFHPQTVPAYATTEIMSQLRKRYADYSYKDAALNPINPRNRAVGWEAELVGSFRGNPEQGEISGVRDTANGPSFYLARPTRIRDRACLACHTTPEQAPPAMVKIYGTAGGYGWKYDEIVGAQIVSVPMAQAIRNADRTFFILMASLTAVFAALFIILNIMISMMIVRPIRRLSSAAD